MSASLDFTHYLHQEITKGQPEMVELYLKHGAQLTANRSTGDTAIKVLDRRFNDHKNDEANFAIAEVIINYINQEGFTNSNDEAQIGLLIINLLIAKRIDLAEKCLLPNTGFAWRDRQYTHSIFDYLIEAKRCDLIELILTITFNSTALSSSHSFDTIIKFAIEAANKASDVNAAEQILNLNKQFLQQIAAKQEKQSSASQSSSSSLVNLSIFDPNEQSASPSEPLPQETLTQMIEQTGQLI